MELELNINGVIKSLDVAPNESLMAVLRREGYYSVKHGCESGECGACTVLVDGLPRPSCVTLAAQAGGCSLTTVESFGNGRKLHPLQEAFIDTGAVQCGFCTPGMLLSALALLKTTPSPSEEEVREALSGNLCRCTGYVKPVQAVLRAAAVLRGEEVAPISLPEVSEEVPAWKPERLPQEYEVSGKTYTSSQAGLAPVEVANFTKTSSAGELHVVGKAVRKLDALKLVTGKAAFADDIELRGMLYARILTSPHAHAVVREIDASEARALPGVHAVLTYQDVPRVPYTGAGQSWPGSGLCDQYALDNRVRFVGDRVAVVAAETPDIAEQALKLIRVDYEVLPSLFDPRLATSVQAPCIHPEEESYGIYDASHNIAAHLRAAAGDVEHGFAQADLVVESEYIVPQVQQAPLETHSAITYWDEDNRLVVRTNTQVPHHVQSIIAPITGLPPRRIRVIKSGVGGDFGVKQEVLVEDLCALLTMATDRPVRLEYTRAEEFIGGRSSHQQIIRMKTGVKHDGTILANAMTVLANTGAYSVHSQAVQNNIAANTLPLYPCPHMLFDAQVVYTNLPPAGTFLRDGVPQGFFALESHLDEIARQLNMDALEIRRKNWIKVGDTVTLLHEARNTREGDEHLIKSCALPACLQIVEEKLQWKEKRGKGGSGRFRRGVGAALTMHSPAVSGLTMAEASLKLNEDGSFTLLIGATDTGTGAETVIAQLVAEVLGVRTTDIMFRSSDTDFTPLLTGISLSATLLATGCAVKEAAERVRARIGEIAGRMLKAKPEDLIIKDGVICAPEERRATISQLALYARYMEEQPQIMATGSWRGRQIPPSFAAQGAEVEVDTETGIVRVLKVLSAIDIGRLINPVIAEGQVEGAVTQALGYGICEELFYDRHGAALTTTLHDYRIFGAPDMPEIEIHMVKTDDPAGPLGAKALAEISLDGTAPAIANAVADAIATRVRQLPLTPERVLRALRGQAQGRG